MQASSKYQRRAAAVKVAALLCLLAFLPAVLVQLAVPHSALAYEEWAKIYLCDEDGGVGEELASDATVKAEDLEKGLWLEVYYDGDDGDPLENVANPGWSYTLLMGADMDYDKTEANGEPSCTNLLGGLSDTVTEKWTVEGGYKEPLTGIKHVRYLYSVGKLSLDPDAVIDVCAVRSSSASASSDAVVLASASLTLGEAAEEEEDDQGDDQGEGDGKKGSGTADSGGSGSGESGKSSGSGGGSTSGKTAEKQGNIGSYTGTPTENAGRIRWTSFVSIDDQRPDKDGDSEKIPTAIQEIPNASDEESLADLGRVYAVYDNAVAYEDSSGAEEQDAAQPDEQIDASQLFLRAFLPFAIALLLMIALGGRRFVREHSKRTPSRLQAAPARGKHSAVSRP